MKSEINVHFLAENCKSNVVTSLVERLVRLDNCNSIIPYIENEHTVTKHTGDILLVSLSFISKIEFLNSLSSKYTYINFINPLSYSQFDEKKLFSQIVSVYERIPFNDGYREKRNHWTFFDYHKEMNIPYI